MSRPGVEGQLAWRDIREGRGRGRLVVLALLLGVAIVVGAVFSFARDGLARKAAQAAGAPNLPAGADAYVFWPARAVPPADVLDYLQRGLGAYSDTQPVLGLVERYEGPGGYHQVLRVETSVGMAPGEAWFSALQGRYPESPGELAVPRPLAELTGLAPGDVLRLVGHGSGETFSFTVSGVYEPRGSGSFYEMLLAAPVPGEPVVVNLAVCQLPERALRTLERIQTGDRALAIRDEPVAVRLVNLAREAYSSESAAMSLGFGLAGAAVFAVLLVGFVERRREIAVYKLVGFSGLACTRVLALELGVAVLAALAAAGPAYYLIAQRLVAGDRGRDPAGVALPADPGPGGPSEPAPGWTAHLPRAPEVDVADGRVAGARSRPGPAGPTGAVARPGPPDGKGLPRPRGRYIAREAKHRTWP